MKKILALLLVFTLVFSFLLVSCEKKKSSDDDDSSKKTTTDDMTVEDDNDVIAPEDGTIGEEDVEDGKIEKLDGKTPAEKYEESFDEINSLTNFTITAYQDIQMVMNYQGQTINQDMVQTIVQKYAGDNFSVVGNATSAGMSVPSTNCQYVDGTVYNVQVTDGMKIKYQATKEQLYSLVGIDTEEPKIFDIPESWFEDVSFYEEENGGRAYIEIILSGEQYKEMFSNLALLSSVTDITDITHRIYFTESGDLDSIVTTATMKMNISGIDTTASFVSTSTISNVGTTVVEAPANASAYTTVSVNDLV